MAPRDSILYFDDGIPVNSATFTNEETWFELIGNAGRTFSYSWWISEAADKGNVKEIADVELDCTGTYPPAM